MNRNPEPLESRDARLWESMRIKSLVFDASVTAISVADTDGILIEANAAFLSTWGYRSKVEVVGRPISDFLDDPSEAAAILAALNETGYWEGSFTALREDDSSFIAHGLAAVVRNEAGEFIGYQSSVLDITERKLAERTLHEWNQTLECRVAERTSELQQSEARFRQLAETTFEGIAIIEGGRLVDGNAQLGKLHGYEIAEMIGRPVIDFIAPDSRAIVARKLREGRESTYESLGLRKDGTTFPTEVHARMGLWHGRSARITALRDLTASKRVAAQLQAQQTDLEHARRLALISEVSAGIIHQISQPLCAIGANLSVIQSRLTACPEKRCHTLDLLRKIDDELSCIRNVMTHMRALAHTDQSNQEPADVNRLLEGVLPLLRKEAVQRGIDFARELGPDLPPVLADEVQLHQVILNLTRNAFDACADCPPQRRKVTITTRAVGETAVELCVSDSGTGIAPQIMEHMFAPFLTTKGGMGIGLRLSRTIVEAHGGRIEASNNAQGIGAAFRVTLPGRPRTAAATAPA